MCSRCTEKVVKGTYREADREIPEQDAESTAVASADGPDEADDQDDAADDDDVP